MKVIEYMDYITVEGKKYPIRDLRLDEYAVNVKISGKALEAVIFDADGEYTSREAQLLDELIFFYAPDDMVTGASDDELGQYVADNLEWL